MRRAGRMAVQLSLVFCCWTGGTAWGEEKWPGIDEAVVKRIAREHGREARKPLIDFGEGDLQLFMFLMAGAVGGFIAGYYWRMLLEGKRNLTKADPHAKAQSSPINSKPNTEKDPRSCDEK